MKLYIGGSLTDFKYIRNLAIELKKGVHSIDYEWWEFVDYFTEEDVKSSLALSTYKAICDCEAYILVPSRSYKAMDYQFELGVVYRLGRKVYLLQDKEGWKDSIFHYLPNIKVLTREELKKELCQI